MNAAIPILVLTDQPELYRPLLQSMNAAGIYHPTAQSLAKELIDGIHCSGILLDVKCVMTTEADMRNRLFALIKDLPVVRARIDPETDAPLLLDSRACLLDQSRCTGLRTDERVKIRMETVWSTEKDPAMTETNEGVLLDISSGGAFLHAPNVLPVEDYLFIKIFELEHKRPIHCAVRWKQPELTPGKPTGIGLMFLDISHQQREEIQHTVIAVSDC